MCGIVGYIGKNQDIKIGIEALRRLEYRGYYSAGAAWCNCEKKEFFVVHNGIIENYRELKEKLVKEGHIFYSECDTEVLPHLIEKHFQGNLEDAVRKALREVRGTYGIAVISKRDPDKIVAARLSSPLLLGINKNEVLVASDPSAVITHTRQIIYLEDDEIE